MSRQETSAKWGWYGGFGGGSLWMIWLLGAFAVGWSCGLAAVLAIVANVALIVYLPPWKHPDVPVGKTMGVMFAFQFLVASVAVAVVYSDDPFRWRNTVFHLAFGCLIASVNFVILGRKTWNELQGKSKPIFVGCDELA